MVFGYTAVATSASGKMFLTLIHLPQNEVSVSPQKSTQYIVLFGLTR